MSGRKIAVSLIVVVVLGLAAWGFYRGYVWAVKLPAAIASVKAKMAASIEPVITELAAKDWDPAAVTHFVSPAWTESSRNGKLGAALSLYKPMGKVNQLHGVEGFNESGSNGVWRGSASERVDFEKMSAVVIFALSWSNDQWLVDGLTVQPTVK